MPDLAQEIRDWLRKSADPTRAPDMQRYMKSQMPFLGVQKTRLTRTVMRMTKAAALARGEWLAAAEQLWDEAQFREERYAALAVLRAGRLTPADEP
ncbi:MAG: DNA alkylation repair protein, partial [Candidatus Nanopelagicales bacterium]|nr:DNA alkylation repair protein [Candidatus Nanopelagicales bacterium]